MKKIILLGYMGSGKSTIGKLLAEKIDFSFFDLDNCIEKNQNMSVTEIFKSHGELFFRKLEHNFFKEILAKNQNLVISLGGGTPCYFDNHLLLKNDDTTAIYLKSSIKTLFDRLQNNPDSRPILAGLNADAKKEFIAKQLFERSFYYHQANHIITTDDKSTVEISSEIEKLLVF
jgi:shikimate kinase